MDEITTLQADVLRTLASPRRLEILHRLAAGPCEVGRLARDLTAFSESLATDAIAIQTIMSPGSRDPSSSFGSRAALN